LDLTGFPSPLIAVLHIDIAAIQESQATANLLKSQEESGLFVHDSDLQIDLLGLTLSEMETLTVGILPFPGSQVPSFAEWGAALSAKSLLRITFREPFDPARLVPEAGWEPLVLESTTVYRSSISGDRGGQFLWLKDDQKLFVGTEETIRQAITQPTENPDRFAVLDGDAEILFAAFPDSTTFPEATELEVPSSPLRDLTAQLRAHGRRVSLTVRLTDSFHAVGELEFDSPAAAVAGQEACQRLLAEIQDSLRHHDDGFQFLRPLLEPLTDHLQMKMEGALLRVSTEVAPDVAAMVSGQLPWLAFFSRSSAPQDSGKENDRSFAELLNRATAPAEATTGETPLEIHGVIEQQSFFSLLPDSSEDRQRLVFLLVVSGERAADVVAYRPPVFDRVQTDRGRLKRANHPDAIPDADGLCLIDVPQEWRDDPTAGFTIPMAFHVPAVDVERLTELSGRCTIVVAGERIPKAIAELESALNRGIEDPDLLAAGVSIAREEIAFDEPVQAYVVGVGKNAGLRDVQVVDAQGNPVLDAWVSSDTTGDGRRRFLIGGVDGRLPEGAGLRLTLLRDLREEVLSFVFREIPIPGSEAGPNEVRMASDTWTPALNQSEFPEGVFVDAQVRWSRFISYSAGSEPIPRKLEVAVDVTGPEVGLPVAVGRLEVHRAQTQGVHWKAEEPASPRFPGTDGELLPYDPLGLTGDIPPDGFQTVFTFLPPAEIPDRIERLHVAFTAVTCDSRNSIVIDDVLAVLDHPLDHPELAERGIRLIPHRNGRQVSLVFEGEDPFVVHDIEALTNDGRRRDDMYSGRNVFRERTHFLIVAEGELPDVLPVRILINENLQRRRVDALFADLPIPPRPVESR